MTPRWFVLSQPCTLSVLETSAPLAARALLAALAWCTREIRSDVSAGRENSRRVRTALNQVATLHTSLRLSRSEVIRGAVYLRKVHAERGGIL